MIASHDVYGVCNIHCPITFSFFFSMDKREVVHGLSIVSCMPCSFPVLVQLLTSRTIIRKQFQACLFYYKKKKL